ncbi:MAG: hypothetical protein JW937_05135 [Candidatus Omnitrophica bacterium]|nr:hypothetical protein [Candidatus Omnitrophota bacterium]
MTEKHLPRTNPLWALSLCLVLALYLQSSEALSEERPWYRSFSAVETAQTLARIESQSREVGRQVYNERLADIYLREAQFLLKQGWAYSAFQKASEAGKLDPNSDLAEELVLGLRDSLEEAQPRGQPPDLFSESELDAMQEQFRVQAALADVNHRRRVTADFYLEQARYLVDQGRSDEAYWRVRDAAAVSPKNDEITALLNQLESERENPQQVADLQARLGKEAQARRRAEENVELLRTALQERVIEQEAVLDELEGMKKQVVEMIYEEHPSESRLSR